MKRRHKFKSCENCGFQFDETNEFCPSCGQENHTHKLPFRYFLLEYLGSIYNFDTKVLRTLKGMFVNPGETIALFNENKRARFVPPVRMFLFSSFLMFLMAGFFGEEGDSTKPVNNDSVAKNNLDSIKTHQSGTEDDSTKVLNNMPTLKKDLDSVKTLKPRTEGSLFTLNGMQCSVLMKRDSFIFTLNDKQYLLLKKTSPLVWDVISKIHKNHKRMSSNEVKKCYEDNKNIIIILLLPVSSFLLFLLYWRKRLFYSEFFIFALFFQSQICFILSLIVVLSPILDTFLEVLGLLIIPLYLILTLKRVYQQSWIKTIIKACLFAFLYYAALNMTFLITFLYALYAA